MCALAWRVIEAQCQLVACGSTYNIRVVHSLVEMRGALQCRRLVPKMKASDNLGHCWLRRQWYCTASQPPALVLGAAQLVATHDLATNVDRIVECIMAAGREGVGLLAFAEAATPGEDSVTH